METSVQLNIGSIFSDSVPLHVTKQRVCDVLWTSLQLNNMYMEGIW